MMNTNKTLEAWSSLCFELNAFNFLCHQSVLLYAFVFCQVREETGFDISALINENDFIETTFNEQLARLYIVPGVPKDAKFEPQTRGEIKVSETHTCTVCQKNILTL